MASGPPSRDDAVRSPAGPPPVVRNNRGNQEQALWDASNKMTIVIGAALVAVGVWASASWEPSWGRAALLPAVIGVIILASGLLARMKPPTPVYATAVATAVAVIGALGSLLSLIPDHPSTRNAGTATVAAASTCALCGLFAAVGIRSMLIARKHTRVR